MTAKEAREKVDSKVKISDEKMYKYVKDRISVTVDAVNPGYSVTIPNQLTFPVEQLLKDEGYKIKYSYNEMGPGSTTISW